MSAAIQKGMQKCSVCKQMTAANYIAVRTLFSRTCVVCKGRMDERRKMDRVGVINSTGTWIMLGAGMLIGALWYFKVDVPYVRETKRYAMHKLGMESEGNGEGTGSEGGKESESAGPSALQSITNSIASATSDFGSRSVTLSLRSDVLFEFGSPSLKAAAGEAMRDLTKSLRQHPKAKVTIRGYTDSIGTEQANLALSLQRAESVRAWMISNGIPSKQLSVVGMGARDPVAANTKPDGSDNPAGRGQNRRVTLTVSAS